MKTFAKVDQKHYIFFQFVHNVNVADYVLKSGATTTATSLGSNWWAIRDIHINSLRTARNGHEYDLIQAEFECV